MVRPLLLIALLAATAAAESVPPQKALLWSLLIPGGGHFRQGETATGLGYVAAEAGLAAWGYQNRNRLADGEANLPWVYLGQVHTMGLYTAHRNARLKGYDRYYTTPVDPTPVPKLVAAPFRWSVIKSPWVWGAALAGAGLNWAGASVSRDKGSYRRLGAMRLQGHDYPRRQAAGAYHAYWVPVSLGAGVSEEMLFRGVLQADWEEVAGPRRAVIGTSVLFGLAHLGDLKGSTVANALFATAAGYHLGRRAQVNRYHLSEVIAAHTWFDITAGVAIFLADPENNPIGADVRFRF